MRRGFLTLLVFLILLAAPIAVRYFRYNNFGAAERAAPPVYDPSAIAAVPTPSANLLPDDPIPGDGDGLVLLDQGHSNQFELNEIAYLDSRLSARGYDMVPFEEGDLASALRSVNAFVVIAPTVEFSAAELIAVERFVERGGRLLLVGDPTRYNLSLEEDEIFGLMLSIDSNEIPLNRLANAFDISFNGDYLYNTVENEGNFQNIIVPEKSIGAESLAAGLTKLAVYGAHSLTVGPTASAVLTGDDNTWSSATDRAGGLVLAAESGDGHVVAIGDVHFMTAPYYTVYDNSGLVVRLADFLTNSSERTLALADFPYFFQTAVNLVFTGSPELGPGAFDLIIGLQEAIRGVGGELVLAASAETDKDTLYVGLYNQADDVAELLADAGVTLLIEPPIVDPTAEPIPTDTPNADEERADGESAEMPEEIRQIESPLGTVQMSGMALILLEERNDQRNMVVLAASAAGLGETINRLIDLVPLNAENTLANCLVQGNLALCPTGIADEPVEAVLDTSATAETDATNGDSGSAGGDGAEESQPLDIDYVEQGAIALDDEVGATLAPEESHAWLFSEGPGFIDITLAAPEMDPILRVVDADDQLLKTRDSGGVGDGETLTSFEIPDDGEYKIIVSDFFNEGGDYTLTVTIGEPPPVTGGGGVFIYSDDDGEPLSAGYTSADEFVALLEPDFSVTTWGASADGQLSEGQLDDYDLFIWDSGDYRDEEGFFSEDLGPIFAYLEAGGRMLVVGAAPTLFGPIDVAPITDVVATEAGSPLTDGFDPDQPIALGEPFESALTEEAFNAGADATVFFMRGPESEGAGTVVGLATIDSTLDDQQTAFLFIPFSTLPEDAQAQILNNLIEWFGL